MFGRRQPKPSDTPNLAARIQSSPFLPPLNAVAIGDLGRVKFPPTTGPLLSDQDRDPSNPANSPRIDGPSTYTRGPTTQRVGGMFGARSGNLA